LISEILSLIRSEFNNRPKASPLIFSQRIDARLLFNAGLLNSAPTIHFSARPRYVRALGKKATRCTANSEVEGPLIGLTKSPPLSRPMREHFTNLCSGRARGTIAETMCSLPAYFMSWSTEVHMDWNRVEGNWKQIKGNIKEKWGKLTDDDLDVINGRRDQLEGKIQQRYGLAKDQVRKDIDDWYSSQKWN
jgi:uncharacterized protein YjbJ (UPF0337 family)